MTEADKKKAATDWEAFKKKLSKDVAIVSEYAHIWGTTYNGMILVESRDLSAFHDFGIGSVRPRDGMCPRLRHTSHKRKNRHKRENSHDLEYSIQESPVSLY